MSCRICDENPCVCDKTAPGTTNGAIRSTYTLKPHGITRDEFGADLYEAIKAASGRRQCLENVAMYQGKGLPGKASEELAKAGKLLQEVQGFISKQTIPPNDVREILRRYPS